MISRMIKERSEKQKDNDRRLSDFFKNYHAKIKEVNKKEILEKVEKPTKKKKEKIKKKNDILPLVKIEFLKSEIII